ATSPRLLARTQSNSSSGINQSIPAFPQLADSIVEVHLNLNADPLPPEPSDIGLIEAVRSAGGIVTIGLKPPTASRSRETGIVPAMGRALVERVDRHRL